MTKWHVQGKLKRLSTTNNKKFNENHRAWIKSYVEEKPLSYLNEIKHQFEYNFNGLQISISAIYKILIQHCKFTKQKAERRSIQIRFQDICRYSNEINCIRPLHSQLSFLDEVIVDNCDMLRYRGWFLKGSIPYFSCSFERKERISILAFLSVSGIIEAYETPGTFNRNIFVQCLRKLVKESKIRKGTVVIMDGAKIHLDPNIVYYLRSVGLLVLFLPAYCPFYNTIEIVFAYLKKDM